MWRVLAVGLLWAQGGVAIGQWGAYYCPLFVRQVGYTPGYFWGLSSEGVFVMEEETRSYQELSKAWGLHASVPNALYSDPYSGEVFLGYLDGMIEYGSSPQALRRLSIIASNAFFSAKRVWDFAAWGDSLAIATDFGIVIWNKRRQEIVASVTQLPGKGFGTAVRGVLWAEGALWAMTQEGLYRVPLGGSWLRDWSKVSGTGYRLPDTLYTAWAYTPHGLLVAWKDSLYRWNGSDWEAFSPPGLTLRGRILALFGNKDVWAISTTNAQDTFAHYIAKDGRIRRLWNPDAPALWCSADLRLLALGSGWNAGATIAIGEEVINLERYARLREGRATYVYPTASGLWFIHGGAGFWGLDYGRGFTFYRHGASAGVYVAPAQLAGQDVYGFFTIASDGRGVWAGAINGLVYIPEADPSQMRYFGPSNVPIWDGLFPDSLGRPTYFCFSALCRDRRGYLWVGKLWGNRNLSIYTPQGQWQVLPYTDGSVLQILEDRRGYKWILYQGGAIRVIDDRGDPTNPAGFQTVLLRAGGGPLAGLPDQAIRCIAADRNNAIWIGTGKGVAVLYGDPFTTLSLSLPVINNRYLLEEEVITTIAVDGQNRKWFGTVGSGVYVISPEGNRQLATFNSENSPLPANYVYQIQPWDLTGEVFMVTAQGIVSYRDWATEPSEELDSLYIFPNPVSRGFEGLVGIRGLSEGATVRIFTADGQLIRYLMGFGGQAVWDLKTTDGRRVSPGIYLVAALDAEGQRSRVGKIVVF